MKHPLLPALAALLAVLLAGCAGTRDVAQSTLMPPETTAAETRAASKTTQTGTFTLACNSSAGVNPFSCTDLTNRTLLSLAYESLYRVSSDFEAVPYLCSAYTASGDGRTHTFRIQSGAKFSDGSAVTAADAAASLKAAMGSAFYGSRLSHVTGVSAASDGALVLTTDAACGSLPLLLDIPIVKAGTEKDASPIGSGPYLVNLSSLRLTRSKGWWQTSAPVVDRDAIPLVEEDSPDALRDDFELGRVSLVCADPNAGASAAYHSDFELWNNNTTVMQYIGFNRNSPVFAYEPIRASVSRALDRDAIVSGPAGGYAVAAALPASPYCAAYDKTLASQFGYSADAFSAAMAASEISDKDGDGVLDVFTDSGTQALRGTMIVCSTSSERVAAAKAAAAQLNAVGFDITVSPLGADAFAKALQEGSFDLYYGETRLSADFDLTPFFAADGSLSYGGTADQAAELLCAKMRENAGNAYELHRDVMERGLLCPVLFKTYAIYSARGAVTGLAPCLDCVFSPESLSAAAETTAAKS